MRETAKLKLVGVRIGLVNANIVVSKNLKIQIGGTEADAQVADFQMGAGGGKELPQQIIAAASRHAVQHVSASAGQTAAEVIDKLLGLSYVHRYDDDRIGIICHGGKVQAPVLLDKKR